MATETETAPVENVEQPVEEKQEEKPEVVTNGDHKTENGNTEAVAEVPPANGEAPNAASTPVKNKKKGRAVMSNMRAAFQRLDLIGQLRTLGRRMRRTPKPKQEQQVEVTPEQTEKPQENGIPEVPSATPAVENQEKCNGEAQEEEKKEEKEEETAPATEIAAGEEQPTSALVVESQNNETVEQTAVVAQ